MEFTMRQNKPVHSYGIAKFLANFGECALEKVQVSTFVHNSIKIQAVCRHVIACKNNRQISVKIHFFVIISLKKHAKPKR